MTLADPSFPSSATFDALSTHLSNSSPQSLARTIKSANTIFAFTLTGDGADAATASWYIDLKKSGTVGRGLAPPSHDKPDVEMVMAERDFAKMVEGAVTAQKLFMAGKIKIKGDVMRAGKVEGVFKGVIGKVGDGGEVKAKL